ncbi:hypothetical protein V1264_024405 [Littorina saxatilis]|uniref:Uncharacterized protein n=1 Tax=Littorina saxatilis TaxID=31220 RepID=A0AAN9AM41_9CAEN
MVASKIKRDNLVPDQSQQLLMWKWISVAAGMVAITSIVINIWLTFMGRSSRRRPPRNRRHRAARSTASLLNHVSEKDSRELVPLRGGAGEEDVWTDSSDEPDEETSFFEKPPSQKLPGSR